MNGSRRAFIPRLISGKELVRMPNEENQAVLTMRGICKQFPGTKALDNVDFTLRKGEIHALMGENGAGKSTLIKVLTGVYSKDAGSIWVEGTKGDARIHSPEDAHYIMPEPDCGRKYVYWPYEGSFHKLARAQQKND